MIHKVPLVYMRSKLRTHLFHLLGSLGCWQGGSEVLSGCALFRYPPKPHTHGENGKAFLNLSSGKWQNLASWSEHEYRARAEKAQGLLHPLMLTACRLLSYRDHVYQG